MGTSLLPALEAQWSATITKIVLSNHACFAARSRKSPIAQSVYFTAPSRPDLEGMSMRSAGYVNGRWLLVVITCWKNGRPRPCDSSARSSAIVKRSSSATPQMFSWWIFSFGITVRSSTR